MRRAHSSTHNSNRSKELRMCAGQAVVWWVFWENPKKYLEKGPGRLLLLGRSGGNALSKDGRRRVRNINARLHLCGVWACSFGHRPASKSNDITSAKR